VVVLELWMAVTVAWYTSSTVRHFPSMGQVVAFLQLQPSFWVSCGYCLLSTFTLCLENIWGMLGLVLYEAMTVLRLKVLCSVCPLGKQEIIIVNNSFATFVATFLENG
jgi:hypothetical protein